MHYEVEQKFPVENHDAIVARLTELSFEPHDEIEQADLYFAHPSRDFEQTDEALRIRRVGDQAWMTYKGPKIDPVTKTRREMELALPPGQVMADQYAQLLEALGFRRVTEVRKRRKQGMLEWQGNRVEVALDEVAELGCFVELEISADETTLEAARASLTELAEALGLVHSERRSYLELLLARQAARR